MKSFLPEHHFIAPMSDVCQQWQQSGQVNISWYLEMLQSCGAEKLLLNAVQIDSPLSMELNKQLKQYELTPEYVVTAQSFCEISSLESHLESGIRFTILFYSPLSADFIDSVRGLKKYLAQLNFVILARKDWNVRNTYRSIPHFMRQNLYVDFPMSLHESDPFYESSELPKIIKKFESDFLDSNIKSYCPNLRLYSEWVENNIDFFTKASKVTNFKPLVTIVVRDLQSLQELSSSKSLNENKNKIEVILTQAAQQMSANPLESLPVTTTCFTANPIDPANEIPEFLLDNFSVAQANGTYIYFLENELVNSLDSTLSLILAEGPNTETLLLDKDILVFKKNDFKKAHGFDSILQERKSRKLDIAFRIAQLQQRDVSQQKIFQSSLRPDVDSKAGLDEKLLAHKFVNFREELSSAEGKRNVTLAEENLKAEAMETAHYKAEQARDIYLSLYKATPKVTIEGHFSYIKQPMAQGYLFMQHYLKLHLWKINPLRLRHFYKPHLWKINPLRLQHFYRRHSWKPIAYIKSKLNSLVWFTFKIAYPIRKIYYFVQFQYEKRVLGLHRKSNLEQGE